MTTATATAARDFVKGQTVHIARSHQAASASGWDGHYFNAGDAAVVSAVRANAITVKIPYRDRWGAASTRSYNIMRTDLRNPNGETYVKPPVVAKPKVRKLGEVPDGMISPEDPRIQWLWADAAKAAQQTGYCGQYDNIADKLGIPGRERDFNVVHKVGGIDLRAIVKAKSQKLANEKFQQILAEKLPAAEAATA